MKNKQQTIVVIGNGMVGHRFVEKLVEFDTHQHYKIVTFCEGRRTIVSGSHPSLPIEMPSN